MKQAIQWCEQYKHMLPDNRGLTLELIQEIQLDAWKQGMTEAAGIVRHSNRTHGQRWRIPYVIESFRDQTKSA